MQEKVQQEGVNAYYKCFIGKGNNSQLVQTLIRNRFWWLTREKDRVDRVNFMWTQLHQKHVFNSLMSKLVSPPVESMQTSATKQ